MRVLVLQHMPFEGVGQIAAWFAQRGIEPSYSRFWLPDATLPEPLKLDLVVMMGGPMSVHDEAPLPWLVAEKAFLREAMAAGVAVLGICLGAQLVASALGARVKANALPEIGWYEVSASATGTLRCLLFPSASRCCIGMGKPSSCRPG